MHSNLNLAPVDSPIRLDREYRRLVIGMKVLFVDENLYVRSLQKGTSLTILDLAHLTTKIAKQSDLVLDLAHLTT